MKGLVLGEIQTRAGYYAVPVRAASSEFLDGEER